MAKVDPFVIPIPRAMHADPEVRFYHEYLNKFLHDLWIRTGGGSDLINDESLRWAPLFSSESEGLTSGGSAPSYSPLSDKTDSGFITGYAFNRGSEDKEILSISADYTTTGNEIIICTNTSAITITLNPNPDDGEEVHIKRQNTGAVAVVGDIDGETSITPVLRYDSPHLVYTVDANEWSIV